MCVCVCVCVCVCPKSHSLCAHTQLAQIKADLRDILHSHKLTQDPYLLARTHVPHDKDSELEGKWQDTIAYNNSVQESVHLPALRPHPAAGVVERQHRQQAVRGKAVSGLLPSHPL